MDHSSPQKGGTEIFQAGELSLTSGINLPTGRGSATSEPPSPSLSPSLSREGSFSRRRLSWGRMERQTVDGFRDPLRLNWGDTVPGPDIPPPNEDPFELDTPEDDDDLPRRFPRERYPLARMNGPSVSSQASLVPSSRTKSTSSNDFNDLDLDDDEARLTSFASTSAGRERSARSTHLDPSMASGMDIERTPDSRSSKRRSARYSVSPSPASRLRSMKRTLRRVSMRVVNLKGRGLDERSNAIRLPDDNGDAGGAGKADKEEMEDEDMEDDLPDLEAKAPLRGRTLGFLGPSSQLRYTMFRVLTQPCVPTFFDASSQLTFVQMD